MDTPTMKLRLKMGEEYPDDDTRRSTFVIEQLWIVSDDEFECEWRPLDMVDSENRPIGHISAGLLYGRTL